MSKKLPAKPPLKTFSTWVVKRDLVKIFNSLTSEAVSQELLGSLSNPNKKILWDHICATLFSLSPDHAHVVAAEQPVAVPEPQAPVNGLLRVAVDSDVEEEPRRRYGKRKKIDNKSLSDNEDSKENIVQLLPDDANEKANIVLTCLKHFLAHLKDKEPANIRTVVDVLNYILSANISGEKAIQICETIWRKKWTGYVNLGAQCFQYMLAAVVNNNCKKVDVKRLVLYKEVVDSSAPWIAQSIPNMAICLTNKTVLSDSSSPGLLSRFFMLSIKYTEVFHSEVKKALINQTKAEAKVYGQIYAQALSKASPDLQEALKNKCLQDYIQKYINVQWDLKAQKMKPHGFLLEALLEELYYSTVVNATGFKLLLEAYEPLLWRNLSSANPLLRATSTKILFLMYPIEPPNTTRVEQEVLTNKQNEFILLALEDPNHVVRLIAIKKIRSILSETWKVMPRPFRVGVCNAIFNKLAFDKSSPDIRKEALITICSFINDDNYPMCLFLSKFFKFLKPSIYDECKQVRKAMLQVLLALQNFRHPKAFADKELAEGSRVTRCWEVVPLHELVAMMAQEESNSTNLKLCVELAFKSIHPSDPEKEKTMLNRVIWLIKQGQQVARNFYENSAHVLSTEEALVFMTKVIGRLGAFYRDFDRKGKPKKKDESLKVPTKGRKRKAAEMGPEESSEDNIEPFEENQEDGTVQNQERMLEPVSSSLRDPELVAGLLDIVMVVWVKHAKELNEKAFAEKRSNFEETVQLSLDFVFREWKDNIQVLGPVLYIGSMLPSKGMKRLLTFCVNRLKLLITNNGGIPDQEIKLLATGVCNWDSPDILLEMTADWLSECLKQAVTNNKNKPKAKKPKPSEDLDVENKATAGLLILEKVFTHPLAHAVIIKKSSKAMMSLLKVTGGVKKVIEHRLTTQESLPSISDDLIHSYFKRYVALINLIPTNKDTNFNPNTEYSNILLWAEKILLPRATEENLSFFRLGRNKTPLIIELLSVVLRCTAIAAHKNQVSKELTTKLVTFCQKLLSTPTSNYLVSSLICTVSGLFVNGVLIKQGKREGSLPKDLLEVTLPKLLCSILDAGLVASKLEMLIENDTVAKNEFRSNIEEIYNAFYAFFPKNSVQIHTLDRAFIKAIFKPLLSLQSSDLGLPYFSEFLLNEFQHSSVITADKFWLLVKSLVEEGMGMTPQGRSAVEVFLVVVGTKWPSLLPRKYVDECNKLLTKLYVEESDNTQEMVDLNQSFMAYEED